jgi:hypothetical protein
MQWWAEDHIGDEKVLAPSIKLYSSGILKRISFLTEIFAGFSLYMSLISQYTPPYRDFSPVFSIYYSPEGSAKLRCAGWGSGDPGHYTVFQNGSPTPSPASEFVSLLGPKGGGGSNTLLRVRGRGTQFGRLDRRPGTLWSSGKKKALHAGGVNSVDYFYFWGMNKKQRSCCGRGGGALGRSAPFDVLMSPKRQMRAAHGRAIAAKTR